MRKIRFLKDLREWKTGEIREEVSNNEAVYLELEGYAEILKEEPEVVPEPIEVIPEVEKVKEVKPRRRSRRGRPRKTKEMTASAPTRYSTKGL